MDWDWVWDWDWHRQLDWRWLPLLGFIGALLLAWRAFNRLAALDSRCDRARADIDVQLKHRHSVLPNLLETVRGFAHQEQDIVAKVAAARASALSARTPERQMVAEADISSRLTQLLTWVESWPHVQSSSHFRQLRLEIADAETRIAASRRFFNAAVDEYNATLAQFPANLVALVAGNHQKRAFLDLDAERARLDETPVLKF